MPAFPDITTIDHVLESIRTWLSVNVLAISNLIQITIVLVAFIASRFAAPPLARVIQRVGLRGFPEGRARQLLHSFSSLLLPITWLVAVWLMEWIAIYA